MAVTWVEALVTRLLFASSTWITGCVPRTAPLAPPEGCVAIASLFGLPGTKVTDGLPLVIAAPLMVALRVAEPETVELMVKVARPVGSVFAVAVALPLAGCWHRHGLCRDRDTCSDRYYTPANDYNR